MCDVNEREDKRVRQRTGMKLHSSALNRTDRRVRLGKTIVVAQIKSMPIDATSVKLVVMGVHRPSNGRAGQTPRRRRSLKT